MSTFGFALPVSEALPFAASRKRSLEVPQSRLAEQVAPAPKCPQPLPYLHPWPFSKKTVAKAFEYERDEYEHTGPVLSAQHEPRQAPPQLGARPKCSQPWRPGLVVPVGPRGSVGSMQVETPQAGEMRPRPKPSSSKPLTAFSKAQRADDTSRLNARLARLAEVAPADAPLFLSVQRETDDPDLQRWASCLLEASILKARKRQAVLDEDFQAALALKELEEKATAEVLATQRLVLPAGDATLPRDRRQPHNDDLRHWASCILEAAVLKAKKKHAVAVEDFEAAGSLKELEEAAVADVLAAQQRVVPSAYRGRLELVRKFKQRAADVEDFGLAANLKDIESQLEEAALLEVALAAEEPSLQALQLACQLLENRHGKIRSLLEPSGDGKLSPGDLAHEVRRDILGRKEDLMAARGDAVIVYGGVRLADLMLVKTVKAEPQEEGSRLRFARYVKAEPQEDGGSPRLLPVKTEWTPVKRESPHDGKNGSAKAPPLSLDLIERRLVVLKKIKERHAPSPIELAEIRKVNVVRDALQLLQQGSRKRASAMLDQYESFLERVRRHEFGENSPTSAAQPPAVEAGPGDAQRTLADPVPAASTASQKPCGSIPGHHRKRKVWVKVESDSGEDTAGDAQLAGAVEPTTHGEHSGASVVGSNFREERNTKPLSTFPTSLAPSGVSTLEDGRLWGACCRIWLPAAVLAAGDQLVRQLAGPAETNLSHLRRKYPSSGLELHGEASFAAPPQRRLCLVALFESVVVDAKLVLDAVDLAETACDVIGEELGLNEDEIQEAFKSIRKEYDLSPTRSSLLAQSPQLQAVSPASAPPSRVELRQREVLAMGFSAGGVPLSLLGEHAAKQSRRSEVSERFGLRSLSTCV